MNENQAKSIRLISSALLVTEAIRAAEAEGKEELVVDLLRAKQCQAWREHNQRIVELTIDGNIDADLD